MGREIVYCGDCGKSLREEEFERGKAHHLDHTPYCVKCRPLPAKPQPGPQASARPDLRDRSESRLQRLQSTRRFAADGPKRTSSLPMWFGGGLAVGGGLILVFLVFGGSEGKSERPAPPPPPPVARKPAPDPPRKRQGGEARPAPKVPEGSPEDLIRKLEGFAATSTEPMAILQRCDEIRQSVRGTPYEPRLRRIEAAAMQRQKTAQLEKALADVRRLREKDTDYERESEVLSMLDAARKIAGTRAGEVQRLIDGYKEEVRKARAAAVKPDPPKPKPVPPPPVRKAPPGGRTVAFQNGVHPDASYGGTEDVMISEEKPARNYGRRDDIEVDGDSPSGTGLRRILLFRWELASIPRGSKVVAAELTFHVTGSSNDVYVAHEVKRPWKEKEATWESRLDGTAWEKSGVYGTGDRGIPIVAELASNDTGFRTYPLNPAGIAMVQRWIDDPSTNHGILLEPGKNDDGFDVTSREGAEPSQRPRLTVILAGAGK